MNYVKQLLIGGVVGFIGAYLLMTVATMDLSIYTNTMVIGLYIIVFMLLGWSFILHRQIKKLSRSDFQGEEEDEANALMYRKNSDYSLFAQSGLVIAILALSIAVITNQSLPLILIGIVMVIASYWFSVFFIRLARTVYPERNLPKFSDPKYAENLLEAADDGEKYVILLGLYKSYNLLNIILIFAIIGSTGYSIATGKSQIFSIVLMSIALLLVNGRYLLAIRNK